MPASFAVSHALEGCWARFSRVATSMLIGLVCLGIVADAIGGQRRAVPRHPSDAQPAIALRGRVFIGGYFYDPIYGPYPWWPRGTYPYWYVPVYDRYAEVRLRVEPKAAEDAAVYVDGFYAGVVDDFNGVFQALPLTPGGHRIVLYLEGYRTVRQSIYLRPGSMFNFRQTLQRLPAGETSEPPEVVPAVPPPPAGTYQSPVTPPRPTPPAKTHSTSVASGFGTLDLYVQPASAEVTIDSQRWVSSDEGHFMVQVPAGKHHVEVRKPGYRQFATEVEVGDGETRPLNVSLMAGTH